MPSPGTGALPPKLAPPYRQRTKGKDENGVGYAKKNALADLTFVSWAALEAHLAQWQREVAGLRRQGSTGEVHRVRFERDERTALAPLNGRPPYAQARELRRVVSSETGIEVDTHRYCVPWWLIGEEVTVRVEGDALTASHWIAHGENLLLLGALAWARLIWPSPWGGR